MVLKPQKAGGPYSITVDAGKESMKFKNILVGDVFLCSGQSNMAYPVHKFKDADIWLKDVDYSKIRFCTVKKLPGKALTWQVCSPESTGQFSATAFLFGRELYRSGKIPLGLLNASVNGTSINRWMSRESLLSFPEGKNEILKYEKRQAELAPKLNAYQKELKRRRNFKKYKTIA